MSVPGLMLGGHVSVAGGIYLSPDRAKKFDFSTFQIFSKNQMQWRSKAIDPGDATRFRSAVSAYSMSGIMVHASYLLNMATSDPNLEVKVREAFSEEIARADLLGIDFLTFHPGSAGDASQEKALKNVAENLNHVMKADQHCTVLIENAAGQGNAVGQSFEQIAAIIDEVTIKDRVAVCLDTCHTWAAGYDIATREGYEETMDRFNESLDLQKLKGIHFNDSKKEKGSKVDRHEQIGKGTIGLQGLSNFILDKRLAKVPMILETPLGEAGYDRDLEVISSMQLGNVN